MQTLRDSEATFYVVKVNGVVVSPRFPTTGSAEHWLSSNPLAEGWSSPTIVPITQGGQEVLLG